MSAENLMVEDAKRESERLFKKYKGIMEDLTKSPLGKAVKINESHHYALGIKLEQAEKFANFANSKKGRVHESSQSDVGITPTHAADIVATNYSTDALNILAGTAKMTSPQQIIYYQNVKAVTGRGNVEVGDILRDPRQAPDRYARNNASETVREAVATTVDGTLTYTYTLTKKPVRRGTISLTVSGSDNFANDYGQAGNADVGQLLGINISATCEYASGQLVITFATNPGNGVVVTAKYATNFEEDGSYPRINTLWANSILTSRVYALGQEMGVLEEYQLQMQLGVDSTEIMMKTLSEELIAEVTQDLSFQMYDEAVGSTTFNRRLPSGVSEYLHAKAFHIKLAQASGGISKNAGRGRGNVIVGDYDFVAYLESVCDDKNSMELITEPTSGIHIRGLYKGSIPVICDPSLAINPSTGEAYTDGTYRGYMTYRGTNNFDVAAMVGTYIPFFTAGNVPVLNNLLKKQGVAGAMMAVQNLVPNFTTRIYIVDQA